MSPSLGTALWVVGGLVTSVFLAIMVRQREHDVRRWQLFMQIVVTCGLLTLLVWWQSPALADLLVPAGFVIAAVPLAVLDLRTGKLPNWLVLVTYGLTVGGLVIATLIRPRLDPLLGTLAGAISFLIFYAALYIVLKGQLGGGDVKLSMAAGAVLGWSSWPTIFPGLLLIWVLGVVAHLAVRLTRGRHANDVLPHGPFVVLGTFAAVLA